MEQHFEFDTGSGVIRGTVRGSNGPLVVMENGLSISRYAWDWLARGLEDRCRVLTYDRLGTGESDTTDAPVSAIDSARRLERLLASKVAGETFILVGYSYGGIVTREYVDRNSASLAAWVLIDPSGADYPQLIKSKVARNARMVSRANRMAACMQPMLPKRLNRWVVDGLHDDIVGRAVDSVHSSKHLRGSANEWAGFAEGSWHAARICPPKQLPITIISAGTPFDASWDDIVPAMQASHRRQAESSEQGEWHVLETANHMSILLNSDHANRLAEIILSLVFRVEK